MKPYILHYSETSCFTTGFPVSSVTVSTESVESADDEVISYFVDVTESTFSIEPSDDEILLSNRTTVTKTLENVDDDVIYCLSTGRSSTHGAEKLVDSVCLNAERTIITRTLESVDDDEISFFN
jgi:hypothetical protein